MPYYSLVLIFSALMLPGIIAEAITLPGLPYMFLVAIIFGFVDQFKHIGTFEIIILSITALLSVIVNYTFGFYGAKLFGATKKALIFGAIGFIIGFILFPPLGGFAGLFLGVFIVEIINLPNFIKAFKKASGSLLGSLAGVLVNMILSAAFIILFVLFAAK